MCDEVFKQMKKLKKIVPLLYTQPNCQGTHIVYGMDELTELKGSTRLRSYIIPETCGLHLHGTTQNGVDVVSYHDHTLKESVVDDTALEIFQWQDNNKKDQYMAVDDTKYFIVKDSLPTEYFGAVKRACESQKFDLLYSWDQESCKEAYADMGFNISWWIWVIITILLFSFVYYASTSNIHTSPKLILKVPN
jgi:hypothetical protein